MYQTILVPIDIGHKEKAKPMIEAARALLAPDGRILLLNVAEDVPSYVAAQVPGGIMDQARKQAGADLAAIASSAGLAGAAHMRTGAPSTAILDFAEEEGADLIIIGSHRPGLQDYLIGSTAARVVRHAQTSVLVMR